MNKSVVKLTPIGGQAENGKSMYCLEIDDQWFIIDAGYRFPEVDKLGVDVIIPNFDYLKENKDKIKAIFITHGHDDVMGALPYLLQEVNVPIYTTDLTADLIDQLLQRYMRHSHVSYKYKIKRVVYSTYQAVSGSGKAGIEDLENGIKGIAPKKFPHPIFNNCLPHIDVFEPDGYTKEEYKMINETRKLLNKPMLPVTATCVRVPVMNCHSESINIEFKTNFDIYDVKMLLQNSPGIILVDDIEKDYYPLATKADGYDEVFVGRIRRDFSVPYGINLWVVADNLRKGAASNAVQILEKLIS